MYGNRYFISKIGQLAAEDADSLFRSPTIIHDGGSMICTDGSIEIMINTKTYQINKWDLIIVFPYSIIKVIKTSEQFDCAIIGVSLDFLSQITLPNKGKFFLNITNHPSITLSESEAKHLLEYKEILLKEEHDEDQQFFEEIHSSILKILILKIFALYSNRVPNQELSQSRNIEIFNTFIFHLLKDGHRERKLDYYAQKLSITASHLSRCIKQVTGRSASDILIGSVINNIKNCLLQTNKSIAEISEEFHFCSTTAFSQYFRKYTSLSPREYRKTANLKP